MTGGDSASGLLGDLYVPSKSTIEIDSRLPQDTYLAGQLILLYPLTATHPNHLRLRISKKYSVDSVQNDYTAPSPSRIVSWKFNVSLSPSDEVKRRWTDAGEAMKAEYDKLSGLMGAEIRIDASDMVITRVDSGRDVHLEGQGSRILWSERTGAWTMFPAPTQSSTTPSWLQSPEPESVPIRHAPQPPAAGSSRFRPISSHLPPKLAIPAMEKAFIAAEKRKRSVSPSKSDASAQLHATTGTGPNRVVRKRQMIDISSSSINSAFPARRPIGFDGQHIQSKAVSSPPAEETAVPPSVSEALQLEEAIVNECCPLSPPVRHSDHPVPPIPREPSPPPEILSDQQFKGEISGSPVEDARDQSSPTTTESSAMAVSKARSQAEAAARAQSMRRRREAIERDDKERTRLENLRHGLHLTDIAYTALADVQPGLANVMGVVLECMPPKEPDGRRRDHIVTIVLTDPTTHPGETNAEDMLVTIFRPTAGELPYPIAPGTPVLFRGLKMSQWNGKIKGQAFSNAANGWVYLANDTQVKISNAETFRPAITHEEIERLKALKSWWNNDRHVPESDNRDQNYAVERPNRPIASVTPIPTNDKQICLGEVVYNRFYNLIFKIIHIATGSRFRYELYVVDGTTSGLPLRNFHDIVHPRVPVSGIFKIDVKDELPPSEAHILAVGNVVLLPNVRSKHYKGLEMNWSEKVTEEQERGGWKRKSPILISSNDDRALEIERRIAAFRSGSRPGSVAPSFMEPKRESSVKPSLVELQSVSQARQSSVTTTLPVERHVTTEHAESITRPPLADITVATHVYTTFTNPDEHPTQTLSEVIANRTYPNKFRVKAKIRSAQNRGIKGNDTFVQKHCCKCNRAINTAKQLFCGSCNDVQMTNTAWKYRLIATLDDGDATLDVVIADEEAAGFLPPLPPVSASTNPNDVRKTDRQLTVNTKRVYDVLQGAPLDSIRPQPYIDWTILSYIVKFPKGQEGPHGEREMAVYRVFGMTTKP